MKIDFNLNNGTLSVALDGRLDTNTAPALGSFLHEKCDAATALIINCEKLTYVSLPESRKSTLKSRFSQSIYSMVLVSKNANTTK